MNLSRDSFVSPDVILADVWLFVGDPKGQDLGGRGWYIGQIQKALAELAFDTYYQTMRADVPLPENLRVPIPKGMFNIRELWLFNGERCDYTTARNVYWSNNLFHKGGAGYLKRNRYVNPGDPFYPHNTTARRTQDAIDTADTGLPSEWLTSYVAQYNAEDGMIILGPMCAGFSKLHIMANGTGCEIGDDPVIPAFLRTAIVDYVCVQALRAKTAIDPAFRPRLKDAQAMLDGEHNPPFDGSWYRAEYRVKIMDSKERDDLKEYLSRMNY